MPPIIGLTPTPKLDPQIHGTFRELQLNEAYPSAVFAAGGIPVMLPSMVDPATFLDHVDGVLLTGGGDIAPTRYGGAQVDDRNYGIDEEHDRFELELFRLAIERNIPVLGICRGLQLMNVALGGSLIHHIEADPADRPGGVHRQQEAGMPADADWHDVALSAHPLSTILADQSSLMVNSFHHQGIRDLAPRLQAVGVAPDGLIEAIALDGPSFVLAVQWHPELMYRRDPQHLRPFLAHVEASRNCAARVDRTATPV